MKTRLPRGRRVRASRKCDLRIAAYALALSRLEVVYKEREIFP